ncbi:GNAT family N-acetyltransferase [Actinoplanes teichomyceticus]|uniref:Acetyltransferase (GNAT) family protein n=1 Tax=Actinoplanes teichomyceticus TaxID=1867 RepID=A0A561WPH0_ACTTI|nr:acetyltransferase (GNAT) family protein [Actinoplanes teichomyceticus]GIF10835.1 hypothetical protein Ate01nite_08670 [Actinoplanes teichomyceticus]
MTWTIEERSWSDPAGAALRRAQRAELDARYGCDDHEPGGPPSASDIDLFLVACGEAPAVADPAVADPAVAEPPAADPADAVPPAAVPADAVPAGAAGGSGRAASAGGARPGSAPAIGCGALRRLTDHSAEIKRMYVAPGHRGSGVATAILRALEDAAVRRGWTTLRLETGSEQPEAIRFYRREGYREIPLYGVYRGSTISRCFERDLRDR